MSYLVIKRFLDISAAIIALMILLPILLVLTISIVIDLRAWPIYTQDRVGMGQKIFTLIKFKTLKPSRDDTDSLIPTRLTKAIRKLGLDELPQLLNVVKGDMSIVGPRPIPLHYLHLLKPEHLSRHQVRPGITGLAQTLGNSKNWQNRFDLDLAYVHHIGFILDMRILLDTIKLIVQMQKDDYQEVLRSDY